MGTTKKLVKKEDGWVQVSNGESEGSIHFIRGTELHLTQQSAQPSGDTASMGEVNAEDKDFYYCKLGSEVLYAKTDKGAVEFSVTPAQEA